MTKKCQILPVFQGSFYFKFILDPDPAQSFGSGSTTLIGTVLVCTSRYWYSTSCWAHRSRSRRRGVSELRPWDGSRAGGQRWREGGRGWGWAAGWGCSLLAGRRAGNPQSQAWSRPDNLGEILAELSRKTERKRRNRYQEDSTLHVVLALHCNDYPRKLRNIRYWN